MSTPASSPLQRVATPGTAPARRADDLGHSEFLGIPTHTSQVIGTPVTLPTTSSGVDEMRPNDLATHILKLPYRVARAGGRITGKILPEIIDYTARRELVLRPDKPMTAGRLHEMMSNKLYRVEAAVMQIVGTVQLAKCKHCLQDNGPFNLCVTISEPSLGPITCANCQWSGYGSRCSFLPPASDNSSVMPSPSGHRRHRSSVSSSASRQSGDDNALAGSGDSMHINTGGGRDVNHTSRSIASLTRNLEIATALAEEINVSTSCPALIQKMADLKFDIEQLRQDLGL